MSSHKWTGQQGTEEVEAILASTDHAKANTQIAKAFLRAIYMTNPENRVTVVEKMIKEFNPQNLRNDREYDFPEAWTEVRWVKKVDESFDKVRDTLKDIKTACGDSLRETAEMVLSYLNDMDGDDQIFFLVCLLNDKHWCPMNFVEPSIVISNAEWVEIASSKKIRKAMGELKKFFMGDIRSRGPADEGSFLYEQIEGLSPKEAIIVLSVYAKNARSKAGSTSKISIIEIATMRRGPRPDCDCENCRNSRAAGNN